MPDTTLNQNQTCNCTSLFKSSTANVALFNMANDLARFRKIFMVFCIPVKETNNKGSAVGKAAISKESTNKIQLVFQCNLNPDSGVTIINLQRSREVLDRHVVLLHFAERHGAFRVHGGDQVPGNALLPRIEHAREKGHSLFGFPLNARERFM